MKIVFSLVLAMTFVIMANAQSTVPNTAKDMMGNEVSGYTTFGADGQTCPASWWDVFFTFETTGDGEASWQVVKADGEAVTVAAFKLEAGVITYSKWHAGAAVWESSNQWLTFWEGQIINPAWKLHVSFDMSPISAWAGCTSLKISQSGGLKIIPLATVTNKKECASCVQAGLPCQTIKMRAPLWYSQQSGLVLSRHTVRQLGVNFGAELQANNAVVTQNLRQGTDNGHAAAYQLQFSFQSVPPQSAGYPACYGVKFQTFTLSTGESVTDQTLCVEIARLLKVAIQRNNAADFAALMPVVKAMNLVGN